MPSPPGIQYSTPYLFHRAQNMSDAGIGEKRDPAASMLESVARSALGSLAAQLAAGRLDFST